MDLTPKLQEIAFARFGETPETCVEAVAKLREMIEALPEEKDRLVDRSDENLIRFIRLRKFRLEKALESTVNYNKFYREHPYCDANIPAAEFLQFEHFFHILEEPDEEGRVVIIVRPAMGLPHLTAEYLKAHPKSVVRQVSWVFERLSRNVQVQVGGVVVLESFVGLTLWDEIKLSTIVGPSDVLSVLRFMEGCLGIAVGGFYFYREPALVSWVFAMVRPFLSSKLSSRFHFCGHNLELVNIRPKTILPQFLGGTSPDLRNPTWLQLQVDMERSKEEGKSAELSSEEGVDVLEKRVAEASTS